MKAFQTKNGNSLEVNINSTFRPVLANEMSVNHLFFLKKETVGFEKGELTKDAFIQLYKIEAQRDDTDVNDINSRLANMGFNKSLTIDQVNVEDVWKIYRFIFSDRFNFSIKACPYVISVSSEIENFNVLLGEIYKVILVFFYLKKFQFSF